MRTRDIILSFALIIFILLALAFTAFNVAVAAGFIKLHPQQEAFLQTATARKVWCRPRPKKRGHWKQSPLRKSSNPEDWRRFLKKWHDQIGIEELTHFVMAKGLFPGNADHSSPDKEDVEVSEALVRALFEINKGDEVRTQLHAWLMGPRYTIFDKTEAVGLCEDHSWQLWAVEGAIKLLVNKRCGYCGAWDSIVIDGDGSWPYCGSCGGV